ncbi:MAG: PAS domain S-box protein [Gammaproteobacteria bacterium]|nr:PAS domain S-box protein [Gammaproteobacteria bacterium]MYF10272.1 PAS domain S-box protein [Gammaproteobacteria bacterium]MYG13132.1 PAS domain S-box protein [Gammaproteobacteria bacterium]MYH16868.1 PAS domain S-box protein [Gammaproteobacteria bacterium]MYK84589.1 PAS domain S-box protein [Gammaproteobacteria bacterium]
MVKGSPPATGVSESSSALGVDKLRRVVDAALDGMVVIDSSGTVLLYNAACERLFGYSAEEVLGNNVNLLMTPRDRRNHDTYIRNYLRTGRAKVIGKGRDVTGRRKDGATFPIRLSVGELRDDADAPLFVGTLHDLTETLGARARIEELRSELMRVARANIVGEMGSALAHELTQPLSAIVGFVEASAALLDQGGGEVPEKVREHMEQAVVQSLRAGDVVRLLREFTARGETERSVNDINVVVEETFRLATLGTAADGIDVKLDLAADLPPALIDQVQIQQVVLNLVRNSIDALSDSEVPAITLETVAGRERVEVVVRDNGPGISPDVRERVFEPFVSTKPDGIGIGLSICRTIIEAHGGRIEVEAGTECGAAFRFSVPVFDESTG